MFDDVLWGGAGQQAASIFVSSRIDLLFPHMTKTIWKVLHRRVEYLSIVTFIYSNTNFLCIHVIWEFCILGSNTVEKSTMKNIMWYTPVTITYGDVNSIVERSVGCPYLSIPESPQYDPIHVRLTKQHCQRVFKKSGFDSCICLVNIKLCGIYIIKLSIEGRGPMRPSEAK